jgi:hypothetical protein
MMSGQTYCLPSVGGARDLFLYLFDICIQLCSKIILLAARPLEISWVSILATKAEW